MTALVIENYKQNTIRGTKRARFHGSLGEDGPWTVLLDLSWEDIETLNPAREVHTIPETTMRFVKLEIVEFFGSQGPAWAYLHVQTGSKSILDTLLLNSAKFLADQAEDSIFSGVDSSQHLSIVGDCLTNPAEQPCSVFARKPGQKSSKCAQIECSASGRRRKRATELQVQHR